MQPYQPFQAQWLMAVAAAFGIAFMLAVGTAGCADVDDAATAPAADVSGGEIPDYDADPVDPEVAPRVGAAIDVAGEDR